MTSLTGWSTSKKHPFRFKRFVDFGQLTIVAVRTGHVFEFARKRAEQFTGVEPVRTALFSDNWVAFGIACFYESLMEDTLIEARAFRDLPRRRNGSPFQSTF